MIVTIYTTKVCSYCKKAKKILDQTNAKITQIEVGKDISKEDFKKNVGLISGKKIETVPQIIINGDYIGGYTDLVALNLPLDKKINDEVNFKDIDIDL